MNSWLLLTSFTCVTSSVLQHEAGGQQGVLQCVAPTSL